MPGHAHRALLYEWRDVPLPGGGKVHPHLGAVPYIDGGALHLIYGAASGGPPRALFDHGIGAVAALFAWFVRLAPGVRRTTGRLLEAILPAVPELSPALAEQAVADQLARFRIRFAVFRLLFKRWKVGSVVVLDPDGKVAEVAAAKALSLPVVEVQHGMFSAREPDYSWSSAHRAGPVPLPLPDKVVVFGPLWSHELVRAGYWRGDEINQCRNPVLAAFRVARARRSPRDGSNPLTVLFASQAYVRADALGFLRQTLAMQATRAAEIFCLRIKVHPLEQEQRGEYARLALEFPRACILVPEGIDGFEELLRADVVVGYTSLMLLEAIGLGIPVVGLRGGSVAEGFGSTFGLPANATFVDECDCPQALVAQLEAWRQPGMLEHRSRRIEAVSTAIYKLDGPGIEDILAAS
jgi:hypothetical protein